MAEVTALLLAPHNDDETLFASFLIQREHPLVVVCFKATKQTSAGVTASTRERETQAALEHLDPSYRADGYEQWDDLDDTDPMTRTSSARILTRLVAGQVEAMAATKVIAPAVEPVGGHPQHDAVGMVASEICEHLGLPLVRYSTYRDGRGRSGHRNQFSQVEPTGDEIRRKLLALACYESQHGLWSTAHHFLCDQNEWHG